MYKPYGRETKIFLTEARLTSQHMLLIWTTWEEKYQICTLSQSGRITGRAILFLVNGANPS